MIRVSKRESGDMVFLEEDDAVVFDGFDEVGKKVGRCVEGFRFSSAAVERPEYASCEGTGAAHDAGVIGEVNVDVETGFIRYLRVVWWHDNGGEGAYDKRGANFGLARGVH